MPSPRKLLLVAALVGVGCRDQALAPPAQAAIADEVASESEPAEADEADEADEVEPAMELGDLDAMDRRELEGACFRGSQAACDRLGH